jgi:hypothetical protein
MQTKSCDLEEELRERYGESMRASSHESFCGTILMQETECASLSLRSHPDYGPVLHTRRDFDTIESDPRIARMDKSSASKMYSLAEWTTLCQESVFPLAVG